MSITTASLLPEAKPRRNDEERLARSFAQYLRIALPDNAAFTHIPLGGQRHSRAAQRLAGMGAKAGFPDYVVVHRGRFIGIELKAEHGVVSAVQRQMFRKLAACGAPIAVCKSLDEVYEFLTGIDVPLRARPS